jgi:DNA-binding XRE family transcriptional regulator
LYAPDEYPDKGVRLDDVNGSFQPRNPGPKSQRKIFLEQFGENVQRRRGKAPPETFAKKVGISARTLLRIERGETKPSFETLDLLANVIGPITFEGSKPLYRRHIAK